MKAQYIPRSLVRWQVLPLPGVIGWAVIRDNREESRSFFKFRAVNFAVRECQFELDEHQRPSELLVYGRGNEFVQERRQFGDVPRHIKG